MQVDPRFKAARKRAASRRRNRWLLPSLLWGGGVVLVGGGLAGLMLGGVLTFGPVGPDAPDTAHTGTDTPENGDAAPAPAFSSAFVDLPGDPMLLRFDKAAGAENTTALIRPPGITPTRAGADLVLVRDAMITREERLITTLPSSREDFAFFQAQRAQPNAVAAVAPAPPPPGGADQLVTVDGDEASWGENLDGTSSDAAPDSFVRTRIENTTSIAFVRREDGREAAYDDLFLRLKEPRALDELLLENGLDAATAARFAETAIAAVPDLSALQEGHILALRLATLGGQRLPVQLSAYTRHSFLGSVARSDTGTIGPAADPWVAEDLFTFAETANTADIDTSRKYRLMDAFYSAGLRNGVPSALVGEAIVLLSQSFDMEAFARPEDRVTLLFSRAPGLEGPGSGQVLYAAITGPGRRLECHVFRLPGQEDFRCYGAPGQGGGGGVRLRAGMITPVQGVLTSGFGPRMHPVLKTAKLHRGVDWAAPTGTPVMAAFDGTVAAAGDGKGYGNLVRLSHPDGSETRYAHLDSFSELAKPGQKLRAGDVIGFVGTTGLSTGPHLHFELHENGTAVDPFAAAGGGGSLTGSSAVEQLTNRIIQVESGGKADAKNPLSTATGLGQFIESTWIRMMQSYRPDLASTMDRAALLALRTDPTISREMVQNLAREGEAYLSARGHQVTAGRLYLAHFLGAEGAHAALSATDDALLVDVLGQGVVNANPFLKGQNVAYVKSWADRKMVGRGGRAAPPPPPPAVLAYQQVIKRILKGS